MSKTPWRSDQYWTSPYNHVPEVRNSFSFPPSVTLHDATLRDGEQTPGIVLRKEDKIEIAVLLDKFGIERIEAGMPAVSTEDAEAIREISRLKLKAKIFSFARAMPGDMELAKEVGADGVIIEVPTTRLASSQPARCATRSLADQIPRKTCSCASAGRADAAAISACRASITASMTLALSWICVFVAT